MASVAPFASEPILLSLQSVTGLKYRTFNCFECGAPFLDRESDHFYRVGVRDLPEEAHMQDGAIQTPCGRCSQRYNVTVALSIQSARAGIPLYMQPQSIYITSAPVKHLRNTHCLECGKTFYGISDRIKLVVDNVGEASASRTGPMEAFCNFQKCKQRWHIRV